jgi:hypothetical protein
VHQETPALENGKAPGSATTDARQNREGHPCPPWCTGNHDADVCWDEDGYNNRITVFAVLNPDPFVMVRGRYRGTLRGNPGTLARITYWIPLSEARKLAVIAEVLAGAPRKQHRNLAAAIRQAAAGITGLTAGELNDGGHAACDAGITGNAGHLAVIAEMLAGATTPDQHRELGAGAPVPRRPRARHGRHSGLPGPDHLRGHMSPGAAGGQSGGQVQFAPPESAGQKGSELNLPPESPDRSTL